MSSNSTATSSSTSSSSSSTSTTSENSSTATSIDVTTTSSSVAPIDFESNTDSTRKLARIEVVTSVEKHNNADALEIATVGGWSVVVRTGEVSAGQKVVYFEIDSLLPGDAKWLPEAVKTRVAAQADKTHFRVKTVKLRNEISQGLLIAIPNDSIGNFTVDLRSLDVGTDVTDTLGVEKYEPPIGGSLGGSSTRFPFPTAFVSKTDETRIQSSAHLISRLHGRPFYITVKHDGASATYLHHPMTKEFLVCSRNQSRERDETDAFWKIAEKYRLEEKLKDSGFAIQGELVGPGVQCNRLSLKEMELHVFNVIKLGNRKAVSHDDAVKFCASIGVPMVHFVESGNAFSYTMKQLLDLSKGKYKGTKNDREGIVVRSNDMQHPFVSFKVINNDYLLKNDL